MIDKLSIQGKIDKLENLLKKYKALEGEVPKDYEDKITKNNKWKPRKLDSLHKKSLKKPDYVLVQYLRANYTMSFQLCKVISGNIIVVSNKGHLLNPRMIWRHGKYLWYIVREIDSVPISNVDAYKLKRLGRSTDDHPVIIKMILGAVAKKEIAEDKKKLLTGLIVIGVIGMVLWLIFGRG